MRKVDKEEVRRMLPQLIFAMLSRSYGVSMKLRKTDKLKTRGKDKEGK